jgi:hypothetical protein
MLKDMDDARGDKESPKDCSRLKSCECPLHVPSRPGLLHFESTLESKKYSQCEHVHECLSLPIYLQAYH